MLILQQGKDWMLQLLSVACISLAAKMEESEVPILLDLQVGCVRGLLSCVGRPSLVTTGAVQV